MLPEGHKVTDDLTYLSVNYQHKGMSEPVS